MTVWQTINALTKRYVQLIGEEESWARVCTGSQVESGRRSHEAITEAGEGN